MRLNIVVKCLAMAVTTSWRQKKRKLFALGFLALVTAVVLCSCGLAESRLDSLADEAAQRFNVSVQEVKAPSDAKACVEFYKRMQMDFIKFKVRYDFSSPLERFYSQTSNSLYKIEVEFKIRPEYDKVESFILKLAE